AQAGRDYVATSGALTFAPHDRTHSVDVTIIGGSNVEALTFFLDLSNESSGTIVKQRGSGTIEPREIQPPPPPRRCIVPRVIGLKLAKARSRIVRAHCRVGRVTRKFSSRRKKGKILAQSPRPGRRYAAAR